MFEFQKIPNNEPLKYKETLISNGSCCKIDGSGGYTAGVNQRMCFNLGGYWVPAGGETLCPKQIKKNCCFNSTLTTNITECQCYKLGATARWTDDTTCTSFAPIIGQDGGACCHWYLDGNDYINKCTQTDSEQSCIDLHEGASQGLKYGYYEGKYCVSEDGDVVCNGTKKLKQEEIGAECIPDTDQECYKQDNILGNCCTQQEDGNILCSITTKQDCFGFWNYFGSVKSCTSGSLCSGVYFQEINNSISVPPTASYSTITTSTNPIELLPEIGTMYQGGLYAGIFEPGVSTVLGNKLTGKAQSYKSIKSGYGGSQKRWLIIVAPSDLYTSKFIMQNQNNSSYDGYYNLINSPIGNVSNLNINGFTDWYIPSKLEMEFVLKNVPYAYDTANFNPMDKKYYLTSTFFNVSSTSVLDNTKLLYSQRNTAETYGDVFLIPEKLAEQNIRLIRRIYLGT